MADTRKDKRAPVSLKVRFKSATVDEFIEHYSKDVSRGGIYIKSSQPMAVGTLLKFQFQLKDESALIRGVGRVVWTRVEEDATADQPAGMGIKFIKMDNDSRAIVERIVDAHAPEVGTYEVGRYNATSAEPVSSSSGPPPSESGSFFPDLPPAELPPPEDRTAVRQATQFLAAAMMEGGTDLDATREAREKGEQARLRQEEVERERREQAEQKRQSERPKSAPKPPAAPSSSAAQPVAAPVQSAPAPVSAPELVAAPTAPAPVRIDSDVDDEIQSAIDKSLPSMIIDPSLEPRAGRPSEEARGSDATPLPRPHATVIDTRVAEGSDEPDTEPPPSMPKVVKSPTTSIPELLGEPRRKILPYVVIAALVLVAAIVALRGAPEERPSEPVAEAIEDDESVREQKAPAVVAPAPTLEAPDPSGALPAQPEENPVEPSEQPTEAVPEAVPAELAPKAELVKVDVVTSPKGAEIWVGDEKRGTAPLALQLAVGVPVVLRARSPGHSETSQELTPGKKPSSLKLRLKGLPWVVHVESTPPGAAVNVGGHRGTAPIDLTLDAPPASDLSVSAKLDGYATTRTRIAPDAFSETDGSMRAQLSLALKASLPSVSSKDPAPAAPPKERPKKAAASSSSGDEKGESPAAPEPAAVKPAEAKPEAPPAEPKPAPKAADPKPEALPDNPFGD